MSITAQYHHCRSKVLLCMKYLLMDNTITIYSRALTGDCWQEKKLNVPSYLITERLLLVVLITDNHF